MLRKLLSLPLAAAASLVFATASPAQTTYTWNGGGADANWSTALNWSSVPGTAPTTDTSTTGTFLVMAGTTQLTNTLDFNLGVNNLTFAAGAGSFVIGNSGGSTLTLGSGGIVVSNNNAQTLNVPVILAANQTWTNNGTFTTPLRIGGTIATGGNNLTVAGSGTFDFTQPLTGGGVLTQNGTGQLYLYGNNTNAGLTINSGTVKVVPYTPTSTALGTGPVTLNGGTLAFRTSMSQTPVTLTAASFNNDTISSATELTGGGATPFGTTRAIDVTANQATGGFAFFEQGRAGAPAGTGLPSNGTITSITNPNQTYQLQPYTATNNTLALSSGIGQTGTLTLATPATFSQLSLLLTGGGGSGTYTARVNFSNSTFTDYSSLPVPDWFNQANPVIQGLERLDRNSGSYGNSGTNPRMYATTLTLSLADQAKLVSSIGITQNSGAVLNIFALSGGFASGFTGPGNVLTYSNAVNVTGNSTIDMFPVQTLTTGPLNLGAQLTVTGNGQSGTYNTGAVALTAAGALNIGAGLTYQPSGPVNLAGFGLTFTGAGNGTFNTAVTGAGTLTKSGGGQLSLTANNNQTATSISGGTVVVLPSAPANNPLGTGPVNLSGGALSFRLTSNPVALTAGSFNRDVVIAAGDPAAAPYGTTASVDAGNPGFAFYEVGRVAAGGGLPSSLTFTAANNPVQNFNLQPYTGNNAQVMSTTNGLSTTGTITLTTPTAFSTLSLLVTSGSGGSTFTAQVNFSDATSATFTGLSASDWFNGGNFVLGGLGRINRGNGAVDGLTTNPRLYVSNLTLAAGDQAKLVTSIALTENSSGPVLSVFGLAGAPPGVAAQTYTNPINVAGNTTIEVLNIPGVTFNSLMSVTANSGITVTTSNSAGLTVTNGVSMTANPSFTINPGTIFNTGALNANGAARTIGLAGTGTWNLTGSGTNFVNGSALNMTDAGVLNLLTANSLGVGTTAFTNNAAGTVNLSAAQQFASLAGNNVAAALNLGANNLTISGSSNATTTYNGRIAGTGGSFSVTGGTGSTTLNNANTYTGTTTVSGGKLVAVMPGALGTGGIALGNGTLVLTGVAPVNGTGSLTTFNSSQWALNTNASGGPTINNSGAANSSLTITSANNGLARSAFYNDRVPLNQDFSIKFRYSQTAGAGGADGMTVSILGFGPNALGGAGGSLGYVGIPGPSFALALNIYAGAAGGGQGVNATRNGNVATPYFPVAFPDFSAAAPGSGREIFFELNYNTSGTFAGQFTGRFGQSIDGVAAPVYFDLADNQINANGPIPAASMVYNTTAQIGVGGFIGFTGGTGGLNSQQVIDQLNVSTGAAVTNYNQNVSVTGGTTGTINLLTKTGATSFTAGTLTLGAGSTGLTVGADPGSVANGAYSLTLGATTLNGNPTFTVANNGTGAGTLTLGALNDAGTARTITLAGTGTLVLGTAATSLVNNTQVNVTGGVLTLNNATAIGNTAQLNIGAATTVNFNAATTVAALTGSGNANLGANALTVGNATNLSGAFSGVIAGSGGSLVKAGTGTLNLTGANTYSGTTSVNAGTLAVNNSTGAGTGSGITTVASGATIMGSGMIGGGLTISGGANLAPGNSIGTLNANAGTTIWASTGKYSVEYDHSGGSFISGTTIDYFNSLGTLNVTAGTTAGTQFTIDLKYVGPIGGGSNAPTSIRIATFAGGFTAFSSNQFTVTGDFVATQTPTLTTSGNDVVLNFTPVPEPATVLGLAAGVLGLAGFARRRLTRAA